MKLFSIRYLVLVAIMGLFSFVNVRVCAGGLEAEAFEFVAGDAAETAEAMSLRAAGEMGLEGEAAEAAAAELREAMGLKPEDIITPQVQTQLKEFMLKDPFKINDIIGQDGHLLDSFTSKIKAGRESFADALKSGKFTGESGFGGIDSDALKNISGEDVLKNNKFTTEFVGQSVTQGAQAIDFGELTLNNKAILDGLQTDLENAEYDAYYYEQAGAVDKATAAKKLAADAQGKLDAKLTEVSAGATAKVKTAELKVAEALKSGKGIKEAQAELDAAQAELEKSKAMQAKIKERQLEKDLRGTDTDKQATINLKKAVNTSKAELSAMKNDLLNLPKEEYEKILQKVDRGEPSKPVAEFRKAIESVPGGKKILQDLDTANQALYDVNEQGLDNAINDLEGKSTRTPEEEANLDKLKKLKDKNLEIKNTESQIRTANEGHLEGQLDNATRDLEKIKQAKKAGASLPSEEESAIEAQLRKDGVLKEGETLDQAEERLTKEKSDLETDIKGKNEEIAQAQREYGSKWRKAKDFIKTHIGEALLSAIVFTLPNLALAAAQEESARVGALDELKSVFSFGDLYLYIPSRFISEDPSNFLPLHVAISQAKYDKAFAKSQSAEDKPLTPYQRVEKHNKLNSNDHYFVDYPEYGNAGTINLNGAQASGNALALNTGYRFVSDGNAMDTKGYPAGLGLLTPNMGQSPELGDTTQEILGRLAGFAISGRHTSAVTNYGGGTIGAETKDVSYAGSAKVGQIFSQDTNYAFLKKGEKELGATGILSTVGPKIKAADGAYVAKYPGVAKTSQWGQVLNSAVDQMHNGATVAGLKLSEITPDDRETVRQAYELGQDVVANLIDSNDVAKLKQPWILKGMYVYQTQGTDLAKAMIAAGKTGFQDYVVVYGKDSNNIVPLQVADKMGMKLNPDLTYLQSLLDLSVYSLNGSTAGTKVKPSVQPTALADIKTKLLAAAPSDMADDYTTVIAPYISVMSDFANNLMKYGPFTVGGSKLSISKEAADAKAYLYQVDKKIDGGATDYVFALSGSTNYAAASLAQLPDQNITFFVSAITGRFYDGQMNPYKSSVAGQDKQIGNTYPDGYYGFGEVKKSDGTSLGFNVRFFQKKEDFDAYTAASVVGQWAESGRVDLYRVFTDYEFNPLVASFKKYIASGQITDKSKYEQRGQILLLSYASRASNPMYSSGATKPKLPSSLQSAVDASFTTWQAAMTKNCATGVCDQTALTGPFPFAGTTIVASSIADIENKIFIYRDQNTQEFIAFPRQSNGTDALTQLPGLGSQYNNQTVAVGLSTGRVFDSSKGALSLREITVNSFVPTDVLTAVVTNYKQQSPSIDFATTAAATYAHIVKDQAGALRTLRQSEIVEFGDYLLYLNSKDANTGEYIYGDITSIGREQAYNLSSSDLEAMITDWYIAYVAGDNPTYGKKLNVPDNKDFDSKVATTTEIISLLSLNSYDKNGAIASTWPTSTDKPYMSIATGFLQAVKSDYTKLRLWPILQKQLADVQAEIQAEDAELEAAADKGDPILDSGIIKDILTKATIIPDTNPNVPERSLRLLNGKYYQVATILGDDGQPSKYFILDYNVVTSSTSKDEHRAIAYVIDAKDTSYTATIDGKFLGAAADAARADVGLVINPQTGVQTLDFTIGGHAIPGDAATMIPVNVTTDYKAAITAAQTAIMALNTAISKNAPDANGKIVPTADQQKQLDDATTKLQANKVLYNLSDALIGTTFPYTLSGGAVAINGFYYNTATGSVYYKVTDPKATTHSYFVDMVLGHTYDVTPQPNSSLLNPHIRAVAEEGGHTDVLYDDIDKSVNATNSTPTGLAFLGVDGVNPYALLNLVYKEKLVDKAVFSHYVQTSNSRWKVTGGSGTITQYAMAANDEASTGDTILKELVLVEKGTSSPYSYDVYEPNLVGKLQMVASLQQNSTSYFAPLLYMGTLPSTDQANPFVPADNDAVTPTFIVWNGDDARTFKNLYFKGQFIPLNGSGDVFMGTMNGTKVVTDTALTGLKREVIDTTLSRSITLTKKKDALTQNPYLLITDGAKTYIMAYDVARITDIQTFNQDNAGKWYRRDVNAWPRLLTKVTSDDIANVAQTDIGNLKGATPPISGTSMITLGAEDQKNLTSVLSNIRKHRNGKHFYYAVPMSGDVTFKNVTYANFAGYLMDLETGIMYDSYGTPRTTLQPAVYYTVLNELRLETFRDPKDGTLRLRYRTFETIK